MKTINFLANISAINKIMDSVCLIKNQKQNKTKKKWHSEVWLIQ